MIRHAGYLTRQAELADTATGKKSRNYVLAECRKSEKGIRLNYENTYG